MIAPTLAELEQDYRLYCVTLPAEREPESFTAYVYHALVQQLEGKEFCLKLLAKRVLTLAQAMNERMKA